MSQKIRGAIAYEAPLQHNQLYFSIERITFSYQYSALDVNFINVQGIVGILSK